ncbi:MAG: prenyltransferase [Anaerolineae bacterium]|nr:prenyltransferase [Anaerolineae bacterium]MDW8069626.1 prenyltransferase [Anaerolineae bacterium]
MSTVPWPIVRKIKGWIVLARPPFHTVGILPFALGAVMAYQETGVFPWTLWGWGTLAVVLIMLSTYLAGEYFDYEGDRISRRVNPNRFAGGSGVLPAGLLDPKGALVGSIVALVLAGVVGLIIWLGYGTGPWTLPLGIIGMIGGFFYSVPPVRWAARGVGELWIAFCYGWLPVAVAYYLPNGRLDSLIHWVSIPIAATIFNVILLNEYPDYVADQATRKRNLLVRLGLENGARLFAAAHALGWLGMIGSVAAGVPLSTLLFYAPVFLLSLGLVVAVLRGVYRHPRRLEVACGLNIAVNLGTTLAYILGFLVG